MNDSIIAFNPRDRLLDRTKAYLETPALLLEDVDQAIDVLLKSIPFMDEADKLKLIALLGSITHPRVVWPLYGVMRDVGQNDMVRHAAAVALSVAAVLLEDNSTLVSRLKMDLDHPDLTVRTNAAFALGWEGNDTAAVCLVECLNDNDPEVQHAAATALSCIGNEGVFKALVDKLETGDRERKRSILFSLIHFSSKQKEVASVYKRYIHGTDPFLRYDALAMFSAMVDPDEGVEDFLRCLLYDDALVRELALARLMVADKKSAVHNRHLIEPLLQDPDDKVRQTAIRLFNRINNGPCVFHR